MSLKLDQSKQIQTTSNCQLNRQLLKAKLGKEFVKTLRRLDIGDTSEIFTYHVHSIFNVASKLLHNERDLD